MLLFTIGYEKLDQKQFMAHLSYHGVDLVADIRKLPVSRKKGFSKTALGETLWTGQYTNFKYKNGPCCEAVSSQIRPSRSDSY